MPASRPDGLSVYWFLATSYEKATAPRRLWSLDRVVLGRNLPDALNVLADSLSGKGEEAIIRPEYQAVGHEDDAGDLLWEALPPPYVVGIN